MTCDQLRSVIEVTVLPDQVPDPGRGGEGAWAEFFGRPAYTITLVQKFAKTTKALVVMIACVFGCRRLKAIG